MDKKFILFAGAHYYAAAGWCEYRGDFDTLEEASAAGKLSLINTEKMNGCDWWQVVDLSTRKIVAWEGGNYGGGPGPSDSAEAEHTK